MNYVGGKYKLLPQILPLFPNVINTFYDMFAGGGNVGANVNAKQVVLNDTEEVVIDLMNDLSNLSSEKALEILKHTIHKYQLSKTNEEGFKQIREDYNNGNKSWNMFYAMLTNAFNYQIRFNQHGGYNMPFGRNRSWFNPTLEQNFIKFVDKLNEVKPVFTKYDFRKFKDYNFKDNDFIYCDPPYKGTTKYKTEEFPYEEFYQWCREMSVHNIVLISEYNMPNDFECIWKKELKTSLGSGVNGDSDKNRIEKLFIHKK